METKKLKILIVDDNKSFRNAVKLFLKNELDCEVIGEATNGFEFIELANKIGYLVDLVLMDIQMPELDGISATKTWCLRNSQTQIIAVTMYTDKLYLKQLIESGFKGCIYKTSIFEEIVNAISIIRNGGFYFNKTIPIV